MECSLENDEGNFLLQTSAQAGKSTASNNLDKPFGMDLSVELGGHSNRSSVVSQVIVRNLLHSTNLLKTKFLFLGHQVTRLCISQINLNLGSA